MSQLANLFTVPPQRARSIPARIATFLLAGAVLAGCADLPSLAGRAASTYVTQTADTRLGKGVAPLLQEHVGLSGVYPLSDGRDAFAARAVLAAAADRTLDVQYYIWRGDTTGTLLFDALRSAAGRGVRVRLLLDDNNTAGMDATLAALDADPLIEVRLFNPFSLRGSRMLGYLGDFSRLNRRMHNKSFTADNQATIIGGRNVGDEYFDAAGDMLFADLDVLAVGPVVDAVSRDFDRYWNSRSAYPVHLLSPAAGPQALAALSRESARNAQAGDAQAYLAAVRDSPFFNKLVERSLPLIWAPAALLSDDPDKVLGAVAEQSKVAWKLTEAMGTPSRQIDLVSPYFVPGKEWSGNFADMARQGVGVFVLTNSLEATDVAAVHAGYAKWRRPMLEAGVQIYELRKQGAAVRPRFGTGSGSGSGGATTTGVRGAGGSSGVGSSSSSLHAKTFAVDGRRVFIGSFNFDPRSADLNTEMGFVIDSTVLAQQMTSALRQRVPERAYKVELGEDGKLHWIEQGPNGPIRHDTEPGTSFWTRAAVGVLSVLPIDWML